MTTRPILRLSSPRNSSKFIKVDGRAQGTAASRCVRLIQRLPPLEGRNIGIRFLPALTAGSKKLYSDKRFGQPVYAATFIRKRQIVLDQELERRPRELDRILTHELFHFVWARLSNRSRDSYEALVRRGMDPALAWRTGLVGRIPKVGCYAVPRRSPSAPNAGASTCARVFAILLRGFSPGCDGTASLPCPNAIAEKGRLVSPGVWSGEDTDIIRDVGDCLVSKNSAVVQAVCVAAVALHAREYGVLTEAVG